MGTSITEHFYLTSEEIELQLENSLLLLLMLLLQGSFLFPFKYNSLYKWCIVCGFNVKADEKIGIGVQSHKTNNKNAVIVECNILHFRMNLKREFSIKATFIVSPANTKEMFDFLFQFYKVSCQLLDFWWFSLYHRFQSQISLFIIVDSDWL